MYAAGISPTEEAVTAYLFRWRSRSRDGCLRRMVRRYHAGARHNHDFLRGRRLARVTVSTFFPRGTAVFLAYFTLAARGYMLSDHLSQYRWGCPDEHAVDMLICYPSSRPRMAASSSPI